MHTNLSTQLRPPVIQQPQRQYPIPAAPNYTIYVVLIFIFSIAILFTIAILIITTATAGEGRPSPPSRRRIHRATRSVGQPHKCCTTTAIYTAGELSIGWNRCLPLYATELTQNRQGHQSGRSGHPLHMSEPLLSPVIASTDRGGWSCRSPETSKPPSSRCLDGYPDNCRYSCITSTLRSCW